MRSGSYAHGRYAVAADQWVSMNRHLSFFLQSTTNRPGSPVGCGGSVALRKLIHQDRAPPVAWTFGFRISQAVEQGSAAVPRREIIQCRQSFDALLHDWG